MTTQQLPIDVVIEREEAIRIRAYELFEARGGEPGRHHEDWLEAQRQLIDEDAIDGLDEPGEAGPADN